MKTILDLTVNGDLKEVLVEPYALLIDVLRDELGLTGTKKGCGGGHCGACTVLLDGKPVNSCLVLALDARGKDIMTVEGLAQGRQLHPLQQAFLEHHGSQCGFCTPGMLLTAKALLDHNPHPTEDEVREALVGNLCRCTGYNSIVKAILSCADAGRENDGKQ
jgi:carbon-monoxide dehydrogenase small subunit